MSTRYREWLKIAEEDLQTAKKLIKGEQQITRTAIYHTQQCAEKALKGFLVYNDKQIRRTHDLELLIEEDCSKINEEFDKLIEAAEKLTVYAVEFRYPPNLTVPSVEDVREAIEEAEKILEFVKNKIE